MKKQTSIISSIIFPKVITIEKQKNIIFQLNMYLSSLRRFQDIINIVLITNEVELARKVTRINKIKEKNLEIIFMNNKSLKCCNNEEGEVFQYAFSKIDMLEIIESYLIKNKKIKKIIISDVDCLFIKVNKLINYASNIRSIAAINYRNELFTDDRFDDLIKECIDNSINLNKKSIKSISINKMAWINSGFMIINRELAINFSEYSRKTYLWFEKNKERVKKICSNHYSDELIFSTIFNFVKGVEIDNRKSNIARLIWTCHTAKITQNTFNPINAPAHLHIPSIKWEKKHLIIISFLFKKPLISKLGLILINIWSIENRLNKDYKKLIFFKLILKIFRMIEYLILIFNKKNFDLIDKNFIKSTNI